MKDAHPFQKDNFLAELLKPKRMAFIVNPNAGTRLQSRIRESVDRYLDHRKFTYGIWLTEKPGHAIELAQKAIEEDYEIVVAVGGDGSINEVASALIHSNVQLGIIPAGSGNGLAMHLGYGRNINSAIQKLNTATEHIIDTGIFNGKPFFNLAGIGFDGLVSNLMKGKNKRGFLPYLLEAIKAGLIYEAQECTIEANGETFTEKCFAIAIANGPMYGYNFQIAPGAQLDDGLFSVVILKDAPRWQYFAAVPSTLTGKILDAPFVQHFAASKISIRAEGTTHIHLDGEGFTDSGAMHFDINPQSLHILVPGKSHPIF